MGGSAPTYLGYAQIQDSAIIAGMNSIINASLTAVWPIVHWLAIIYLIILFCQVASNQMTVNAGVGKAIRLIVVVFVIHSAGIYTKYVRDLAFTDVPNEIATIVTGSPVGISAASQFDHVAQAADYLVADAQAKNTGSIFSVSAIGNSVALWLADIGMNIATAIMFGVWLLGRKLLAIVLCFGPWLLLFELFDRTRGFTEQWIGKIVGLLVFQLASAALLQIMLKGQSQVLQAIKASPGISLDAMIGKLMHLVGYMATDALTMIALPAICAIGSGAAAGHAVTTGAVVGFASRSSLKAMQSLRQMARPRS